MRRPYVHLAGDMSGWPLGTVPSPGIMKRFDQFSSELVNGDEGGSWAPATPIVIGPYLGGAAIDIDSGSLLSGDVVTVKGNGDGTEVSPIPGLVLSGAANPEFQSLRTRKVIIGFTNFTEFDSAVTTNIPRVLTDPLTLGAKFYSSMSNTRIISAPFPLRAQHRGGYIESVDFRFIIAGGALWTAVPGSQLRFRIARIRADVVATLHTNGGGYDTSGHLIDPAATVTDFTNNGQVRTLSYVPDQNNGPIDPDQDWYVIQVRPPGDARALGSIFLSATVTITNIPDLRE